MVGHKKLDPADEITYNFKHMQDPDVQNLPPESTEPTPPSTEISVADSIEQRMTPVAAPATPPLQSPVNTQHTPSVVVTASQPGVYKIFGGLLFLVIVFITLITYQQITKTNDDTSNLDQIELVTESPESAADTVSEGSNEVAEPQDRPVITENSTGPLKLTGTADRFAAEKQHIDGKIGQQIDFANGISYLVESVKRSVEVKNSYVLDNPDNEIVMVTLYFGNNATDTIYGSRSVDFVAESNGRRFGSLPLLDGDVAETIFAADIDLATRQQTKLTLFFEVPKGTPLALTSTNEVIDYDNGKELFLLTAKIPL